MHQQAFKDKSHTLIVHTLMNTDFFSHKNPINTQLGKHGIVNIELWI